MEETEETKKRISDKVEKLLKAHRAEVIESLGTSAFDILTPLEVKAILGISSTKKIPEYIRQGWIEQIPGKDIGTAHQYYRWRVEFAKRCKQPRNKKENTVS